MGWGCEGEGERSWTGRQSMSRFSCAVVCGAMWLGAGALGDPVIHMDLTQLSASYDSRTNVMIAQSVNVEPLSSAGSIERLLSPGGVATFAPPGFVSNDQWSFVFFSTVVMESSESAAGFGFITAMDHDGDAFRADLRTSFRFANPGVIEMNAIVRNFEFTNIVDGVFEGSDGQGWSMDLGSTSGMSGDLSAQVFGGTTFFSGPFAGRDMHMTGNVVPVPAVGVVVGLWGVVAASRRRRVC